MKPVCKISVYSLHMYAWLEQNPNTRGFAHSVSVTCSIAVIAVKSTVKYSFVFGQMHPNKVKGSIQSELTVSPRLHVNRQFVDNCDNDYLSVDELASQSIRYRVCQRAGQSVRQRISESVSPSVRPLASEPANQPISESDRCSFFCFIFLSRLIFIFTVKNGTECSRKKTGNQSRL